jgi:sterol desaturase/sphingolipid hydroxylase (fatty acid hydroxylase superfamily)
MQAVWDVIVDTAELMGRGEGFIVILWTYLFLVVVERLIAVVADKPVWHDRDALANVISGVFVAVVGAFVTGSLFMGVYLLVYEHLRVWDIPFVWWGWVLVFLLNDLAYYTDHRIAHRTGFFWALHVPHHSSREMNFLVANRGTVLALNGVMSPLVFVLPLLGVHPAMFLAVKFFANLWGIFNHTRLVKRMGFLEGVMMTPSNHRVHHGTEPKYLDRNYAQVFLFWDRLFGTYQREDEEPTYGLVRQMDSFRLWDIQTWGAQWLVAQLRAAPGWRNKLKVLVMPPGWSHDGRHETAEAIRAQHASREPPTLPRPVRTSERPPADASGRQSPTT